MRGARPSGGGAGESAADDDDPETALQPPPPPVLELELLGSATPPPMLLEEEDDEDEEEDDDEAPDVCFLYLCRGGPSFAAVGLFRDLIRAPLYPILSAGGKGCSRPTDNQCPFNAPHHHCTAERNSQVFVR